MTKSEWEEAKEKITNYQSLAYELDKVDTVLRHVDSYVSFTINTHTTGPNVNITMSPEIKSEMIDLLQNYKDRIVQGMEEI